MMWRLVAMRTTGRWLEADTFDPEALEGFGLEIPEGAKVHSILPAKTQRAPLSEDHPHLEIEEVLEWFVVVAVPIPEAP